MDYSVSTVTLFQWIAIESAKRFGVPVGHIYNTNYRTVTEVSRARWLTILTAFAHLNLTVSQIGRLLNRHHSTVLYGLERAKETPEVVGSSDIVWAIVEAKKTRVNPST